MFRPLLSLLLLAGLAACAPTEVSTVEGTVIRGTMENANGLTVFLDKLPLNANNASQIVSRAEVAPDGSFELADPAGLSSGPYRLRFGAKRLPILIGPNAGLITVNGNLNELQDYNVTVTGSPETEVYVDAVRRMKARELGPDDVQTFVDTTSSPLVAMFTAYSTLGGNGKYLDVHRSALKKYQQANANSPYVKEYETFINQVDASYKAQMAAQRIRVGEPAPDIKLESPDGKEYALSDLKGQVVLLDFWASWCGPCRRENPNVVKVYDRYKDQGFTVYSVSLDRQGQKQRWVDAIKKDNLKWPYHVSDLQYWQSAPAKEYGVKGIPRTFLIDREGKIAAVGLRGAQQIESELKKVI